MTRDIDLASLTVKLEDWEEAKTWLRDNAGYYLKQTNLIKVVSPNDVEVDLIPYGPVEQDGKVEIGDPDGLITVLGFEEVCKNSVNIIIDNTYSFNLASLAGICLLKLIAYNDNPGIRTHDLSDIQEIARYYFELNDDEIYEHENDLFDKYTNTDDPDYLHPIGSHFLGRKMYQIACSNEKLVVHLKKILENLANNNENPIWPNILHGFLDGHELNQ